MSVNPEIILPEFIPKTWDKNLFYLLFAIIDEECYLFSQLLIVKGKILSNLLNPEEKYVRFHSHGRRLFSLVSPMISSTMYMQAGGAMTPGLSRSSRFMGSSL